MNKKFTAMGLKQKIEINLQKIKRRYLRYVEKSYNLRQTNEGQSDYYAFEAQKLMEKINRMSELY